MELNKKNVIIGSILISVVLIVITMYYGFIKLADLKDLETKNEPIGGMYGVNLGDNIETLFRNPNLFAIDKTSDSETKYDYITTTVSGSDGESNKLIIYATKDSGTIYEIIYKNYIENDCTIADIAINKLRKQYGLGNYNVMDAIFNMKTINKDNRSIYVSCGTEIFERQNKMKIHYKDKIIEDKINEEYKQYKIKRTNADLKLN
jgi:hypothetical protein